MQFLRFAFFLVNILLSFSVVSARELIEWLKTEHDFGIVNETGGVCKTEFRCINKDSKSHFIREIKVSCGCTDVVFPKDDILKGDTAVINVEYDPEERPGKFNKNINIYLDEDTVPVRLNITGNVIASPETLNLFYPYGAPPLHFDSLHAKFGQVTKGNRKRAYIDIYNSGKETIIPEIHSDSPAVIYELVPKEVNPGEKAVINIILDSSRMAWVGDKLFKISVYFADNKEVDIEVSATVIPAVQ